mgnify:FL=1
MLGTYLKKFGCALIGWNPQILAECGEASIRQFYKLTSAITIMMLLWGTIGYCFAGNYMNMDSLFLRCIVSLMFMVIIVCIERVIILTVGKATGMTVIRVILAIVMALLGSTIFDQMIFRNDIETELQDMRTSKIESIVASRVKMIDAESSRLSHDIDSLNNVYVQLVAEYQKKPVLEVTAVESRTVENGKDSIGNPMFKKVYDVKKDFAENPIKKELDLKEATISSSNDKLNGLIERKLNIQNEVIDEFNQKPSGFIEELMATVHVVGQSGWTIFFYVVMFLFLMLLETFVVSIKMADTKCDYDLIVEHQLKVKETQLRNAMDKIQESYVTKTMKDAGSEGAIAESN